MNVEVLEMLTTPNLRKFRVSWIESDYLEKKYTFDIDENKIGEILLKTSIICPVNFLNCKLFTSFEFCLIIQLLQFYRKCNHWMWVERSTTDTETP